jgi:thioester reductase-like protein
MIVGCVQAGFAPDVRHAMDMTPVDYVAKAMVYLSRQPESVGKVFHLLNPLPISWSGIFDMVIDAGYPVTKVPFEDWVSALDTHADPESNPLHPMLPFFHIGFARRMIGITKSHFQVLGIENAQNGLAGSGIECPPVDRDLINTFLAQFVRTGHLPVVPAVAGVGQLGGD